MQKVYAFHSYGAEAIFGFLLEQSGNKTCQNLVAFKNNIWNNSFPSLSQTNVKRKTSPLCYLFNTIPR